MRTHSVNMYVYVYHIPSPYHFKSYSTLQTLTKVNNTHTKAILDVFCGVESISDVYLIIRDRLGGVQVAFSTPC